MNTNAGKLEFSTKKIMAYLEQEAIGNGDFWYMDFDRADLKGKIKKILEFINNRSFDYYIKKYILLTLKDDMLNYDKNYSQYTDEQKNNIYTYSDDVYNTIIREVFAVNGVPLNRTNTRDKNGLYVFSESTAEMNKLNIIQKLKDINGLTYPRRAVLAFGFGFKMPFEHVDILLQKGLGETCIDAKNTYEVLYAYCYNNDINYKDSKKLRKRYKKYLCDNADKNQRVVEGTKKLQGDMKSLQTEEELFEYLKLYTSSDKVAEERSYSSAFKLLLEDAFEAIDTDEFAAKSGHGADVNKRYFKNNNKNEILKDDAGEEEIYIKKIVDYLYSGMIDEEGRRYVRNLKELNDLKSDINSNNQLKITVNDLKDYLAGKKPPRNVILILSVLGFSGYNAFTNTYVDDPNGSERFEQYMDYVNKFLEEADYQILYPPCQVDGLMSICALNEFPILTLQAMIAEYLKPSKK